MSVKQIAILAAVSLSFLAAATPASRAATSTAAVAVSAIVAPHCSVGSPSERHGAERTHSLAVACDMSVPYTVTYDDGSMSAPHSIAASNDTAIDRVAATVTY